MAAEPIETIIPLLTEHLRIDRRVRETGRVRVSVSTEATTRLVEETLRDRLVEIERVPVGRTVTEAPAVREEGDTLIFSVMEEVLVVERRLVLREEVRVRLRVAERHHAEPVQLRHQDATIERLPPAMSAPLDQQQKVVTMRTITGLFDSRPEAERLVEALVQQHGIDRNRVQVHAAGAENTTGAPAGENRGFLASIRDLFLPDDDRATYEEGLRRGGIMVAVQVSEEQLDGVMDVFEEHNAVDLDAREQEWRQGGWTGGSMAGATAGAATAGAATAGMATHGGDAVLGASSDGTRMGVAAMPATAPMATGPAATAQAATSHTGVAAGEEVIPLMEERLRVGKRQVAGGRVRIRSYTVETPVQEQVMLREEHIGIERRAVDRPLTDADQAGFQDRVIEATETSEEAVVSKEVRVREEIVVRKETGERTETVSDTVRHTEVEVEDDRVRTTGPAAGTASPSRNPQR